MVSKSISKSLADTPKPKPANRWWAWALGAVLLGLAGWFGWQQKAWLNPDAGVSKSAEKSIAVLPFRNLGAPENDFFAEGIMGQVHASLARIEDLKVISKNSSMLFRESQKTIPQIAEQLQVGYVLGGTVLQKGAAINIGIELVRASDDKVVWTKNYEGQATRAAAFMNTVAREVAGELDQKLNQPLSKKLDRIPTQNPEAYTEYLQGQQLMQTRTKDKLAASIQKFDAALALDPTFADACAYKASAYFIMGNFGYLSRAESIRMAEKNAIEAIRLDPENGLSYAVLAGVYKLQYKWDQSISTYQIALRHSPNDAQINYWYGVALRSMGRFDEAIQYNRKAVELDPLFPVILVGYINSCSYARDFEQAKKAIDKGTLLFDNDYMYHFARATYYVHKGNYVPALAAFQQSDSLTKYPKNGSGIAYCQAKLGQRDKAMQYIRQLPKTPENYIPLATAYAGLGDKEACFRYLQLAADQDLMPDYFKVSPLYALLHNDPRFDALLVRFGLLEGNL